MDLMSLLCVCKENIRTKMTEENITEWALNVPV